MRANHFILFTLLLSLCPLSAWSHPNENHQQASTDLLLRCIANQITHADNSATIAQLKSHCTEQHSSLVNTRQWYEAQVADNPFAILPHKPNYLLPLSYSSVDTSLYDRVLDGAQFDSIEAKFQISIKYIAWQDVLMDDVDMQFSFTATSWWQMYNSTLSAPFRETNYEPEFIISYSKPWQLLSLPVDFSYISINHQSNGKAAEFSRSWNRIIGGLVLSHGPMIYSVKTWWRIPEPVKTIEDGLGDDNPDIEDYLGRGELSAIWNINHQQKLSVQLRNNLQRDNKGAITVGWSFPINSHLQGYVEYFNGYGESLIYYNQRTQQIGVGIKLTDWI